MQAFVIRGIYGNLKLALSGIGLLLLLSTLQAQELTPPAPLAGWLEQAQIPARAAAIHIQELELFDKSWEFAPQARVMVLKKHVEKSRHLNF